MDGLFHAYIPAEEAGEYMALDARTLSGCLSAFIEHFDADNAEEFVEKVVERISFEDVEFLEIFVGDLVSAMKGRETVQDNPRLVLIVHHYLLQLDQNIRYQPDENYWAWKKREQCLVSSLRSRLKEVGAVISEDANGSASIVLCGVKASSTNGIIGACGNWVSLADAAVFGYAELTSLATASQWLRLSADYVDGLAARQKGDLN
ncbi:hypothetical protein [uncultured Cohaesibacter sp.]|uniref:hypothetical protein n=1 Tax=uncultured Cohaesibacter sp. TaxID=1002546 RepID=UPI0029C8A271|nr:hypothetical protein [uncultured Cohaesibacter sp.]